MSKLNAIHKAVYTLLTGDVIITANVDADNIDLLEGVPAPATKAIAYQADYADHDIILPSGEYLLTVRVTVPEKITNAHDIRATITGRVVELLKVANMNDSAEVVDNLRCRLIQLLGSTSTYDPLIQVYNTEMTFRTICDDATLTCS